MSLEQMQVDARKNLALKFMCKLWSFPSKITKLFEKVSMDILNEFSSNALQQIKARLKVNKW